MFSRRHKTSALAAGEQRTEEAFADIYARGGWGGLGSGYGSSPSAASPYVRFVLEFIDRHAARTVVDAGCGDWSMWPDNAFATVDQYIGVDVVESVIARNLRVASRPNRRFDVCNLVDQPLPDSDLLICKEVLQHLDLPQIHRFLARSIHQYPLIILCEDISFKSTSYARHQARRFISWFHPRPELTVNGPMHTGGYRPVDFSAIPFAQYGFELVTTFEVRTPDEKGVSKKAIWQRIA